MYDIDILFSYIKGVKPIFFWGIQENIVNEENVRLMAESYKSLCGVNDTSIMPIETSAKIVHTFLEPIYKQQTGLIWNKTNWIRK